MKSIFYIFSISVFLFSGVGFSAEKCPSTISYKGGRYLKSGSTFYYPNGRYLKSGSTLYYDNGRYLKSGSTIYYSNGRYLKSGSTLYYPNGRYIKSGSTYYYENGRYLKSGSTYYYDNGRYARSGSTLYRPDGSQTVFPVTLISKIDTYGEVRAIVEKKTDKINVFFGNLLEEAGQVKVKSHWDGETFAEFKFFIDTGYQGELVALTVNGSSTTCELLPGGGGTGPAKEFKIHGRAASIDVKVNDGFDPREVGDVLKKALDSIGN